MCGRMTVQYPTVVLPVRNAGFQDEYKETDCFTNLTISLERHWDHGIDDGAVRFDQDFIALSYVECAIVHVVHYEDTSFELEHRIYW
jgi:hypothetical protein